MNNKIELADNFDKPGGDISFLAVDRKGNPLADQFSIFKDPNLARELSKTEFPNKEGYLPIGDNLIVNTGRQTMANLLGGRDFNTSVPDKSWIITKSSFGTFDEVVRFTDQTLSPQPETGVTAGGENEIAYNGVDFKKPIQSVDWPQPFIVRFEIILGVDEGNGNLIQEMGLWTDNEILFARKAFPSIEKSSDFGISFVWRIRT